ncbi:Fanconi anemia group D2 protein [Fasciola gigantica]|uniref:Fanconi anemia group D2 protein n=1 Tax=Fasciola gigantica TaxID=46835 RepID=A0A504YE34_FASGI|nr:Fanconi anemia group D2 protein [Fasciola gigantica]
MFSRLSGALGCPRSKEHSSTDDSVPDSENWLSQSVRSSTVFVVPAPNLQEVLHAAGVSWSSMTGQFYFDTLTTNTSSERQNPWSVAHSARQRSKLVELLITQADDLSGRVVRELRHLATNCDENLVISGSATFSDLLVPLLTEKPLSLDGLNNDGNDNMLASTLSDDVLILFGSPATTFQLLLSVSSLRSLLTELIMELVATSSPHSIRLLEQFKQPVGLTAMFGGKRAFAETATRLLELFQVVSEPTIQASILTILPDLASSPCAANCALTDEDRATLILKLTDLLGTTPTGTLKTVQQQADPIACLIECLTSFSVDRQLAVRLPDTLFELLDRCYTPEAYYAYLPLITRSLVIHGPAISRQSTELTKLTRRLRTYFKFPETPIESTGDSIETTLMELLRVAFQFNRQLMVDAADTQIASGPTGLRHTGSNLTCLGDPGGGGSAGAVGQVTRLQNEAGTLARRLVASGRLFPEPLRRNSLQAFFTSHGSLLTNTQHRLFPALLYFIDQLITSPCSNSIGLSSSSVDMSASVRAVGSAMYTGLFCAPVCIGDQRRCIVTHLVRHGLSCLPDPEKISRIRRGTTKQKAVSRTGLLALFRLARIRPSDLAQFDTILFGMMDRVIRVVTAWTLASSAINSDSSNSTWHSDQAYTNLMRITRLIVLILAWLGFCDRQQRSIQERLLAILRKQLSSLCLVSKALGVIGAVMVLETICRRSPTPPVDPDHADEFQVSTQNDESIVLASQLTHVDQGRTSTSTTSTSRTSTTSCLSLRGPGTLMADDPHEIHIPIEDTEEDPDDLDEHSRTTRTSDSVLVTRVHTPPSRLLLQLIGLVEHAIGSCSQLYAFWLDELGACFVRLAHSRSDGNPPAKVQSDASPIKAAPKRLFGIPPTVQADRLLAWMGARVLRDFQVSCMIAE